MASMIIVNNINSIRSRFILFCGMILLWLYFTSMFLPSKKPHLNSSESPKIFNNSPNGAVEEIRIATNDEPFNTDTFTQTSSSSTTTTTKRTTLPAVVFIPKPKKSTTATPSSSDKPTQSFISTNGLNVTNDTTIAGNSELKGNSSSILPNIINDDENAISNSKNVWDQEKTGNSDSEFLESEDEGSGSGLGGYEVSTPEYLEDFLNYKRIYPRFKNPINEEYLSKIAHD